MISDYTIDNFYRQITLHPTGLNEMVERKEWLMFSDMKIILSSLEMEMVQYQQY